MVSQKKALPAKGVLETILDWSVTRPLWQRDALRRIVDKGKLEEWDIAELGLLCKAGRGGPAAAIAGIALDKTHLPANPGAGSAVSLLAIKDVSAANALAPGQTLLFGAGGLTIVYGDNGAGKSGYARILKRACRARARGQIHGNIYSPASQGPASATIDYAIGATPQTPLQWRDTAQPDPTLSAVSVFDSECASVHIGAKNEVAFRPFGLDVPDELANTCQQLKDGFTREQRLRQSEQNPLFKNPPWKVSTAVGRMLGKLRHDTKIAELTALATLSDEETNRRAYLKEALSKDLARAAAEQKGKADNVKSAIDAIARIEAVISDGALSGAIAAAANATARKEAARLAAADAFSRERLPGVGAEVWRALWDVARKYSTEVAYPASPFPATGEGDVCVLCQQQLADAAKTRLRRFEAFVQADTARVARDAVAAAAQAINKLKALDLRLRPVGAGLREIQLHDAALAKKLRRYYAASRLRRYLALRGINNNEKEPRLPATVPPTQELTAVENRFRQRAFELRNSANADERTKLETELAELDDRTTLADSMMVITQEIARLRELEFLGGCIDETSTAAITMLGNQIADSVITPQLRDRFQEEIVKLAAERVRVEIVRSGGRFGSPQYEVKLFAKPGAKVADVLSEGEKTCVALAAFLTELATAQHVSTLVFDDPVSSLDHRWRRQVAKRLAEESTRRQIIVFTHDLIFANDLIGFVPNSGAQYCTVTKDEPGAGIVMAGLPWEAQRVEHRLDRLEKDARAARALYDAGAEGKYRAAVISFYNALRATWERALEEIAFAHIILRHRDYIDSKWLKKATVLTEADCDAYHKGFKKCCDVTDSHDPSMGRNAPVPPGSELLSDVQALKDWASSLRDRQKLFNK